jgi:metal-responsive CopG/Arc/MetJ family transcriptional regulator
MQAISLRLPDPLFFELMAEVKATAQSQTEIVREAISSYLKNKAPVKKISAAQAGARWKGIGKGPSDLSTNPKYMEGFGQ